MSVAAIAVLLLSVAAQDVAQAPSGGVASGRVVREDRGSQRPAPGVWVTLHRIGRDSAGPVDSARTSADGRFRIAFRPWGDPSARYVATAMWGGIAYASARVEGRRPVEITVYDTATGGGAVHTASRHAVVSGTDAAGSRTVVEVFAIENTGFVTRMPAADGTWRSALPDGATGMAVGDGDIAPDAVLLADGYVTVRAPLAPGVRQLTVSYRLPAHVTNVAFTMGDSTGTFELLVDDSTAVVRGANVHEEAPTATDGRVYRRFAVHAGAPGAVVSVQLSSAAGSRVSVDMILVIVVAAAMVATLARVLRARPERAGPSALAGADSRD